MKSIACKSRLGSLCTKAAVAVSLVSSAFMYLNSAEIGQAAVTETVGASQAGGWTYTDFQDDTLQPWPLTSLVLRAGANLNFIRGRTAKAWLVGRGSTVDGCETSVTWPADECLVRVYGTYGSVIGKISFVTNKGRVLGPFGIGIGEGSYMPNGAGREFDLAVPPDCAITGFVGTVAKPWRSDRESHITRLGICYGGRLDANYLYNPSFEFETGWTGSGANTTAIKRVWAFQCGVGGRSGASISTGAATAQGATGYMVAELDFGRDHTQDGFYQDVVVENGKTYELSVDIARRPNTVPDDNAVEIWWEDPSELDYVGYPKRRQCLATVKPASDKLVNYKYTVTASSGRGRVHFRQPLDYRYNNGCGGMIDNVLLKLVP